MSTIEVKAKLNEKCENRQPQHESKSDLVFLIDNHSRNDAIKMDNLKKRRKRLVIFLIIVVLSLFSIVILGRSLNSEEVCALSLSLSRKKLFTDNHISGSNNNINNNHHHNNSSSLSKSSHLLLSYDDVLNDDIQNKFDINSNDVMVMMIR
jgi:hypothetical protein